MLVGEGHEIESLRPFIESAKRQLPVYPPLVGDRRSESGKHADVTDDQRLEYDVRRWRRAGQGTRW